MIAILFMVFREVDAKEVTVGDYTCKPSADTRQKKSIGIQT